MLPTCLYPSHLAWRTLGAKKELGFQPGWAALKDPGEGCSPQGRTLSGTSHCPLRQEKREGQGQRPEPGAEASDQELGVGKIGGWGWARLGVGG